jgi:hypothetical protein
LPEFHDDLCPITADVMRADIRSETIVAVIGHTNGISLFAPRDGHEHRAEDLLAR